MVAERIMEPVQGDLFEVDNEDRGKDFLKGIFRTFITIYSQRTLLETFHEFEFELEAEQEFEKEASMEIEEDTSDF